MSKKTHPLNWVKHYRTNAGLTLEKLADKIGMTSVGLSYIEKSERRLTLENAKKIADALGVHYVDIIEGPANVQPQNDTEREALKILRQMNDNERALWIGQGEGLLGLKNAYEPEDKR